MATGPAVETLLRRSLEEGPVLPLDAGAVGIFDAALALEVEVANTEGLKLPGSLSSLARRRAPENSMAWREARALLIQRSRQLSTPPHLERLHGRMQKVLAAETGRRVDFTALTVRAFSRALLPLVIDGLPERAARIVASDQERKFQRLAAAPGTRRSALRGAGDLLRELAAGRIIARALKRRTSGAALSQEDYADTIAALVERIGIARAAYLVSTLLTATAAPPGLVASSILFELIRRPDWRTRIRAEMEALAPGDIYDGPARRLPQTMRFIKEAMRLWPFPLVTHRVAFRDLDAAGTPIARGCPYDLSPYVLHRSPRHWSDPDAFDPDRWLEPAERPASAYVPFGFGPRSCVGAAVGQPQLILFCELAACRFDFELAPGHVPDITLDGLAIPRNLVGRLVPAAPGPAAA